VDYTVGGQAAKVFFSGLAGGFTGLYQVNAYDPAGVSPGDAAPLFISAAGFDSAPVLVYIQRCFLLARNQHRATKREAHKVRLHDASPVAGRVGLRQPAQFLERGQAHPNSGSHPVRDPKISLISQRLQWVNLNGPPRRRPASQQRDTGK